MIKPVKLHNKQLVICPSDVLDNFYIEHDDDDVSAETDDLSRECREVSFLFHVFREVYIINPIYIST